MIQRDESKVLATLDTPSRNSLYSPHIEYTFIQLYTNLGIHVGTDSSRPAGISDTDEDAMNRSLHLNSLQETKYMHGVELAQ